MMPRCEECPYLGRYNDKTYYEKLAIEHLKTLLMAGDKVSIESINKYLISSESSDYMFLYGGAIGNYGPDGKIKYPSKCGVERILKTMR